nr:hypothetical protein Iba_chr13cCG0290 [Ipomoea batatas]GMD80426.1 hypothetical protein Iba_chr13eCG1750 [Ipomoea batatas]GME15973.1 hypothetical protein Iba_scaffold16883CG0840 [Ipomoea batatas]GME17646.1 hypothetical protein Iba_scaffold19164CG0030 [Ipomoea batatas]
MGRRFMDGGGGAVPAPALSGALLACLAHSATRADIERKMAIVNGTEHKADLDRWGRGASGHRNADRSRLLPAAGGRVIPASAASVESGEFMEEKEEKREPKNEKENL